MIIIIIFSSIISSISGLLCFLIKLSLSQPMIFPFYPFLLPIHLQVRKRRDERVAVGS